MTFARRTSSTLFLWALVAAVFFSRNSLAFLGFTSLLVVIASIEYFGMLRQARVSCFPVFGVLASAAYSVALTWPLFQGDLPPENLELFAVSAITIGAFCLQLRQPIDGRKSLLAVGATVLGFIYISVLFHFSSRLLFVPMGSLAMPGTVTAEGAYLLLWLIAVTKFTDMGAYITGSLIGRHKMIPHVSPAKTWEGFGGALLFAQIAGIGLFLGFPERLALLGSLKHVVILGLILALLAVVGDLAESVVKRALKAKDSGQLLPGIGGSLDLIDSVCFTAPALYFYLQWIVLPPA